MNCSIFFSKFSKILILPLRWPRIAIRLSILFNTRQKISTVPLIKNTIIMLWKVNGSSPNIICHTLNPNLSEIVCYKYEDSINFIENGFHHKKWTMVSICSLQNPQLSKNILTSWQHKSLTKCTSKKVGIWLHISA